VSRPLIAENIARHSRSTPIAVSHRARASTESFGIHANDDDPKIGDYKVRYLGKVPKIDLSDVCPLPKDLFVLHEQCEFSCVDISGESLRAICSNGYLQSLLNGTVLRIFLMVDGA